MKTLIFVTAAFAGVILGAIFGARMYLHSTPVEPEPIPVKEQGALFLYTFNYPGVLEETESMQTSRSAYFWLNSGARLIINGDYGSTLQNELPQYDRWYREYNITDPTDTSGGKLPQNLFRLITRATWENARQSLRFNIQRVHMTDSPNRGAHSGVFLMSRYEDSDNLYYVGVRQDGMAVIKKKYRGMYYTLAETRVFSDPRPYDRINNPNLIPVNTWLTVASNVQTISEGVLLQLWMATSTATTTNLLLEALDDGRETPPLLGASYAGIRTDFADVLFDDYKLEDTTAEE